ncbi:MAG: MGMT family protein [Promethearchaeota archaeon]
MTPINIGIIKLKPDRWLAFAIEKGTDKLVACTSSQIAAENAETSLKNALRRLKRFDDYDEGYRLPLSSKIGQRLGQLMLGKGQPFDLKEISQKNWSPARLNISKQLLQVPKGKVISYGGLARLTNSSPRGVGSVMRSNPVPWAVPCHRVIHSDGRLGKLGGTISGTKEKARILQAEGVLFNKDGTVGQKVLVC